MRPYATARTSTWCGGCATRAGGCATTPDVAVAHREPSALRHALARRFRYGTAAAPLAVRHPGRLSPAVLRPWPALMAALLLCRRPWAAAMIASQQSAVLANRVRRLGLPPAWGIRWFAEATYAALLSVTRYATTFALPVALPLRATPVVPAARRRSRCSSSRPSTSGAGEKATP